MYSFSSICRWLLTELTSIPSSLISYLLQAPPPPPPPLLPLSTTAAVVIQHPVLKNLHTLQLGMPAFVLATTTTLALVLSQKFPAAPPLNFAIVGSMAAAALLWNAILFGKIYLQAFAVSLCLLFLYGLVASSLPIGFSCACWLCGAFCLMPFLYLLIINPQPQPAPASLQQIP